MNGFVGAKRERPTYYYGRRHSYAYYPVAWTDDSTGTRYESGYYDEDGQRYDSVVFEKNGKYENVVCKCQYCGKETVLDLTAEDVAGKSLNCESCGAPLQILSELDQAAASVKDSVSPSQDETEIFIGDMGETYDTPTVEKRKVGGIWWGILAALLVFNIGRSIQKYRAAHEVADTAPVQYIETVGSEVVGQQTELGENVFLEKQIDGSYHIVTDVIRSDKILYFDSAEDSYYDEASDCWLWYNTDVEPAVWQYWYEGISSEFGDYGWMEHDSDGWWIEESYGNWIQLPEQYDTDGLWYID